MNIFKKCLLNWITEKLEIHVFLMNGGVLYSAPVKVMLKRQAVETGVILEDFLVMPLNEKQNLNILFRFKGGN